MSRSLLASALIAAACLVAAAPASAKSGPAAVSLEDCRDVDESVASFYGRMRSVSGSQRMWMRFRLLQRIGTGAFQQVEVPGLGSWRKSKPGARRFNYLQTVRKLDTAGSYRTLVHFRWYDSHGRRLASATRRSGICEPPSALPNLRIGKIAAVPSDTEGSLVYQVNVRNDGGDARDVAVQLRVDGQALDLRRVAVLGSREVVTLEWTAPACSQSVRAVVDPSNLVLESRETDNLRTVTCPVPGS